jgi:integrase
VWLAAEAEESTFAAFLRVLLFTGQRREKVATMRWSDISPDGVWTIPRESPREKVHAGALRLPPAALAIINAQPRCLSNEFVFAGRRPGAPISGFTSSHTAFKKRCGIKDWTLHDCRRTARSLLSRAGVLPHIAERTLGHAVGGITAVYDHHHYHVEKADALGKLAALIEKIVHGEPGDNVVQMHAPAAVQP